MKGRAFFIPLCIAYTLSAEQKVADVIDSILLQHNFSGAVLASKRGQVIIKKSYSPTTTFHIASLTKQFTAVALLLLQERGLVDLHAPLVHYFPHYAHAYKMTAHHLLTHRAGIANYQQIIDPGFYRSKHIAEAVNHIQTWPLDFEPGTAFCYSNSGYLLLARLIELVSGQTYQEFIQQHMLQPLGMHHTGFLEYIHLRGNGDVYTTIDDMQLWDEALRSEKLLSKASRITMQSQLAATQTRHYGYGWFVEIKEGRKCIEHNGCLRGSLAHYVRYIDDDITIILLSDREEPEKISNIIRDIIGTLFKQ